MPIKFSICICNFNMADTITESLISIIDQIDKRFEIVIIDDGSTDTSVEKLRKLKNKFSNFNLIELKRDNKRKLGFTRNISIQKAKGEYILLHLDCDDICGPYIKNFVNIFLHIEKLIKKDFFLSGRHIHMAKKVFLLQNGPFVNIYRGEDRELWKRLRSKNSLVILDHKLFIFPIKRSYYTRYSKSMADSWDHLVNDFRSNTKFFSFNYNNFFTDKSFSLKVKILRASMSPFAFLAALIKGKYKHSNNNDVVNSNNNGSKIIKGSYIQIINILKGKPNLEIFDDNSAKIFVNFDK